jgi:hypothetical protein
VPFRHNQEFKTGGNLNALDGFPREGVNESHSLGFFLEVEDTLGGNDPIRALTLHAGVKTGIGAAVEVTGASHVGQFFVKFLLVVGDNQNGPFQ